MTTFIHTAISPFLQLEINYVKFPRNDRENYKIRIMYYFISLSKNFVNVSL